MLFEMLFTSTVLIVGMFCLRKLTLGKISMGLRYGLWLLVAARLLVPVSVGTGAFSVMNLLPGVVLENAQTFFGGGESVQGLSVEEGRDPAAGSGKDSAFPEGKNAGAGVETADGQSGAEDGNEWTVAKDTAQDGADPAETASPGKKQGNLSAVWNRTYQGNGAASRLRLLGIVWLLGFLAVGGYMLSGRRRFAGYLYRNRRELPAAVPGEFAERLSARRMKVYQVKGLPGPCLVGRHIYIGEWTVVQEQNLTHILAHEYCHALHRDGFWAFLRCALAAVYWFDPFVWAAAYAARQDSELACDEAAVKLLGEPERFAYGRTLLSLLENAGGGEKCPGMSFMTAGGERSVRERITALAKTGRKRKAVLAAVLAAAAFVCGCAFTGAKSADPVGKTGQEETGAAAESGADAQGGQEAETVLDAQNRQMLSELENEEFARIQEEYGNVVENARLMEEQTKALEKSALEEADRAAFEETLKYHSDMDDRELLQKREFDVQAYYDWRAGKGSEKPEDGWYLLCREEGGLIYLYGLYTEDFGFRGLKIRIGQDVTTLDIPWCASHLNGNSGNIRILEYAENRAPRRFVWKLLAEESSTKEIWRLYGGYRYDTGAIDLHTLTEEDCLAWAKEHLSFTVDREAAQMDVIYDGDMYLGAIDISAYQEWEPEGVQIVSDAVAFTLDDPGRETLHRIYSDTASEGTAVYLTAGLKLKGNDDLWFDGLPLLTVQVVEDENSASGFRLESPRIDETYVANAPWQEKALGGGAGNADAVTGHSADDAAGAGRDDLEEPLVNGSQAHHDLEIAFINPCPGYDRISDQYGERVNPATQEVRTHTGVDLAADEGTDILAAADGTVFMRGFDAVNGNYVALWHGQSGQMTYYAHCKTIEVEKGQEVAQGEKIATVGQTGMATGPFLHFAISSGTNWEEPYFWSWNKFF